MQVFFCDKDITVGGRPCRTLTLAEGECVWICVAGRCLPVTCREGRIVAAGFAVCHYDLVAVLRYDPALCAGGVLVQRQWTDGCATVLDEVSRAVLWWERGEDTHCLWLPALHQAQIEVSQGMAAVLVYGRATRPLDASNPLFGVLVDMAGAVLYRGYAASFALDEQLVVECAYEDMRRHRCTRRWGYREGDFCILEQMYRCASTHTCISTLVPYLFAEALAVGDEAEARTYLCADLDACWDELRRYVGSIATLDSPPWLLPDNVVAWADAQGIGKRFAFTLRDGAIADVAREDI